MDFTNCKMGIYMLPVAEGDCFYIQLPISGDKVFRIMIDCGPATSWDKILKPFLQNLEQNHLHIDLLIITHLDSDHIGGALKLFNDEHLRSLVNEVWFNSLRHIAPILPSLEKNDIYNATYSKLASSYHMDLEKPNEPISAKQAHILTELIEQAGTRWNFKTGKPICKGFPSYLIGPEVYIDILLPTQAALKRLYDRFTVEVNSVRMGTPIFVTKDSERAFELSYCNQESVLSSQLISSRVDDLKDIREWANQISISDDSIPNAASIALCIRYYGKTILFSGDATSGDLIDALKTWSKETKHPLKFDVIKLPHHGSARNCMDLLDSIDGTCFLISTDGKKYSHPDKETLAKIVTRPVDKLSPRILLFNYENEKYKLFSNELCEEKYHYQTLMCDDFQLFCE